MKPHRAALAHLMKQVSDSTDMKLRKLSAGKDHHVESDDIPTEEIPGNEAEPIDVEGLVGEGPLSDDAKLKLISMRKKLR